MLPPRASPERLSQIVDFLSEPLVSSLFSLHPNDLGTSAFHPPSAWTEWWDWAGESHGSDIDGARDPWLLLLQYYDAFRVAGTHGTTPAKEVLSELEAIVPATLRSFVHRACRLAASRNPSTVIYSESELLGYSGDLAFAVNNSQTSTNLSPRSLSGMSPKKAHEVVQMSDFTGQLLASDPVLSSIKHAVDVGAGQVQGPPYMISAYLSRSLRDRFGLHVLALDFSDIQSQGAAKRDAAPAGKRRARQTAQTPYDEAMQTIPPEVPPSLMQTADDVDQQPPPASPGSLTYFTTKIDADTLVESTDTWIAAEQSPEHPIPILFVALHACGSLTPDIIRAFITAKRRNTTTPSTWTPSAAVIVGCCYNMLRPEDFPLSHTLQTARPNFTLTANHLQLAAQVPSQWTRTPSTLHAARLALRKVVWRALIEDVLSPPIPAFSTRASPSDTTTPKRLGRLNDAAYADWPTFAARVQAKLGLPDGEPLARADPALERRIEVFHVLRCIAGPVIESLLLLDRATWAQEMLKDTNMSVELVNLFDQASGSGRNVALIIRPQSNANGSAINA
ncbi:hypothetical protein C8Q77DRAFT_1234510 [Trametes polyzona]|nr:hypothetical protein C8Q77DRAFT_1234510 [Trametes polyzona]